MGILLLLSIWIVIANASMEANLVANLVLSKHAPLNVAQEDIMTYTLHYNNFGNMTANDVEIIDTLPPEVIFISASDNGIFNPKTREVKWYIGSVDPWNVDYWEAGYNSEGYNSGGTVTVTVRTDDVDIGTVIQNSASIWTIDLETDYNDNSANVSTRVMPAPEIFMVPFFLDSDVVPTIHWNNNVTFGPYECDTDIPPTIRFEIENNGDVEVYEFEMIFNESASNGKKWEYTIRFRDYDLHGNANVTYIPPEGSDCTVLGPHSFYIDPAGYIYDVETGERIDGATVWLQRPDGNGGWENVSIGLGISIPDVNPLVTGTNGQYQWDVRPGPYRVYAEAPDYYPENSIMVNIPPPVMDLHVGLKRIPTSISGMKFADINKNGIKDIDESGLPNWIITLKMPDGAIKSTTTDNNGIYTFDNLSAGTYIVGEVMEPGWNQTAPDGETYTVTISVGEHITNKDFGNCPNGIPVLSPTGILVLFGLLAIVAVSSFGKLR